MAENAAQNAPADEGPRHSAVVTADDRRAEVLKEYGQYVATEPIDVPGTTTRVFNVGDPVPASHVTRDEVDWVKAGKGGNVAKVGTEEAKRATRAAGGLE